jgi:hypothetical protein
MHGYGTYNFGNGDRYSGDWREGSRHGKGDYTFRNGCRYSGELLVGRSLCRLYSWLAL